MYVHTHAYIHTYTHTKGPALFVYSVGNLEQRPATGFIKASRVESSDSGTDIKVFKHVCKEAVRIPGGFKLLSWNVTEKKHKISKIPTSVVSIAVCVGVCVHV